ncbi:15169_t:CDS:2 [Acaulospora morrowiae]|uniref:15169_t:CDS:1 n=1 Tax=Acaulospora morrowiae TaxID=94023 RepID=A0A9N8VZD4_9GLOM|nr:15169_t:CDS:2 [Acaulospora morrowiae]
MDDKQITTKKTKKQAKVKTIPGISKYYLWQWPIEGPFAEYILAQLMPFIGKPIPIFPSAISNSCHKEIIQPNSKILNHTTPTSKWMMLIPILDNNTEMSNITNQLNFCMEYKIN